MVCNLVKILGPIQSGGVDCRRQNAKGFSVMSCPLYICAVDKAAYGELIRAGRAKLPKSYPQDAFEVRIQASRMAALATPNE